jgi:hypothetical protein
LYRSARSFVLALCFIASTLAVAQTGVVSPLDTHSDSAVPEAVRSALGTKGYRITLDDGSIACELWLAKNLSTQATKDVPGVAYPQLAESAFVGVLHFPKQGSDYRGQPIAAGYYSLRYELLPNDGNHLGAAPNRDFLLLLPAASDPDPAASLKVPDVMDRSRKASGTRHPAPLSLLQPDSSPTSSITKGEEDHWIFSTAIPVASGGTFPIALVVKGQAQQ